MNSIRNSVTLIGNLGQDPEVKEMQNGRKLAKISIATHEIYTNKEGQKVQNTDWHYCVGWGKTAELMQNLLKKGRSVAIKGKLTYNNYEDGNGIKRTLPQIVIDEFVLLDKKNVTVDS